MLSLGRMLGRGSRNGDADGIAVQLGELQREISELRAAIEKTREALSNLPSAKVNLDVDGVLKQLSSKAGRNALNHFFAWNHRWIAMLEERNRRVAKDTYDFIDENLRDAVFMLHQMDYLSSIASTIASQGKVIVDFGVHSGWSVNALAKLFPEHEIHGFDSFEGLPEDWEFLPSGFFSRSGKLPKVADNVRLHAGWFEDTLPVWVEQHRQVEICLFRIDCDLYSSTKTVLHYMRPFIRSGSYLLFDELIGYRGWEKHEYKAFNEFLADTGMSSRFVAYGLTWVLVQVFD